MTDIYLISGFLGAGKTTLLQKLLREAFSEPSVALVENDFGSVSLDSAILKEQGYSVEEIRSGCICCSLTGDFVGAVSALLKQQKPEILLVEPSGVAKLSEVEALCRNPKIASFAAVRQKITVVDAEHCCTYCNNFGEFFEDQITHAHTIVFSHSEQPSAKLEQAQALVHRLNPFASTFSGSWDNLNSFDILAPQKSESRFSRSHFLRPLPSESSFSSVTFPFSHPVELTQLAQALTKLQDAACGTVLRVKGIVQTRNFPVQLQFVCGQWTTEPTTLEGNEICIIGKALNEDVLKAIFAPLGSNPQ